MNNVASQLAWFQNLAQPVVGALLVVLYVYAGRTLAGKRKHSSASSIVPLSVLVAAIGLYVALVGVWVVTAKPYAVDMCARPSDGCEHHLEWPWTQKDTWIWYAYFAAFCVMILATLKNKAALLLSFYLVATCAAAATAMPFKKAMGSWWCVFAVGGPLFKLLVPARWLQ